MFALVLAVTCSVGPSSQDATRQRNALVTHSTILDAFSWTAYDFECARGDVISGWFNVACDGSLYTGDEQKYDDWSLEGIQFYVLDEYNYSRFLRGESFVACVAKHDVLGSSWSFIAQHDGTMYVIYENNTVHLMSVEGSIDQSGSPVAMLIIVSSIIASVALLGAALIIRRRERTV
jgi:hypothetical protein